MVMEKLMRNIKTLLAFVVLCLFIGTHGYTSDNSSESGRAVSKDVVKEPIPGRTVKLDGIDVDLARLEKESRTLPTSSLGSVNRREKNRSGKEVEIRYDRRAKYFPKNKHVAVIESKNIAEEVVQGHLKIYKEDGTKIFETQVEPDKDGDFLDYGDVEVLGDHHVVSIASKYIGENKSRMDIYDIKSNEVVFSTPATHVRNLRVSPDENYVVFYNEALQTTYRYDLANNEIKKLKKAAMFLDFSSDGKSYVLAGWEKMGQDSITGNEVGVATLYFYKGDVLVGANKTKPYEISMGGGWNGYSVNSNYYIYCRNIDVKIKNNRIESYKTACTISDTSNGRTVAEGQLRGEIIEKYKNETIADGDGK